VWKIADPKDHDGNRETLCRSTARLFSVIQHFGMPVYSLSASLVYILVWTIFEALMWIAILVSSERPSSLLIALQSRIEFAFGSVLRRPAVAVGGVFLVVFVGRLALIPLMPIPPPKTVDDFSQLLAADTFACGRVTNPTHPMWFYFETFMVNQKPTYHSMYPPATGLVMAAAQVLTGQPWYGMLFAMAAAAAGVCWMLRGWAPPRWAPWGSLVFILLASRDRLAGTYSGEQLVVLGGALVLGAIPRIVKKRNSGAPVWLGIGAALLATTRPYEGAFLLAGLGLGGVYWAWTTGMPAGTLLRKVALPVAVVLVPVLLAVGYLNWRTTGSSLVAPYQLNLVQQHITRPFIWQKPASPAPTYDHAAMASFYEQWELGWWNKTRGFRGIGLFFADKVSATYAWVLWPLGFVVGLGAYQLLSHPIRRFLTLTLAFFLMGLCLEAYQSLSRYVAPALSLLLLLAVYGIRYIGASGRKSHQGLRISRSATALIPAALFLCSAIDFGHSIAHRYPERWYAARQEVLERLTNLPGKQLVIVRYSPVHVPVEEWVCNQADIDSAKVVWARDVPDRDNSDLLGYFHDRTVWLLEPDGDFAKLTPYHE
jgi:hypothetical protein